MKSINLLVFIAVMFVLSGCGFFKDYSKGGRWSYFEEWDTTTDSKIDKTEFEAGCVEDGFIKKGDRANADAMFTKADENQDGFLSGLEFYRWKIDMDPMS